MRRRGWICSGLAIGLIGAGCGGNDVETAERQRAVAAAMDAYKRAFEEGVELDSGPCIAEELVGVPGWVADIVHDPREPIDDEPANQCRSYAEGEAEHFVELTPEGEVIRAE